MGSPIYVREWKFHAKVVHNLIESPLAWALELANVQMFGPARESRDHWPTEIRLRERGGALNVRFEGGDCFDLTAEYLRVMSPSAEVQGHRPEERLTVGGKRHCRLTGIEPIGTYAVRLIFDDLHSTGIFTWDYLYELGHRHSEKWALYEAELKAKGLSRDRPGEG
jgi:DUF971 family protein